MGGPPRTSLVSRQTGTGSRSYPSARQLDNLRLLKWRALSLESARIHAFLVLRTRHEISAEASPSIASISTVGSAKMRARRIATVTTAGEFRPTAPDSSYLPALCRARPNSVCLVSGYLVSGFLGSDQALCLVTAGRIHRLEGARSARVGARC